MRQQVLNRFLTATLTDAEVLREVDVIKRAYKAVVTRARSRFQKAEKDAFQRFSDTDVEQAARDNVIARAARDLEEAEVRAYQKLMASFDQLRQQAGEWAELVPTKFRIAQDVNAAEGPFNQMSDHRLNKWLGVWENTAPENFWMDGELRMSRSKAYQMYRERWRKTPPHQQQSLLNDLKRHIRRQIDAFKT